MAAYKTDINLFKAAGGERAKFKQVSKTKRLMAVVVVVVILVAAAMGVTIYMARDTQSKLDAEVRRSDAYKTTIAGTQSSLTDLADVNRQILTQNAIEFAYTSNMWTADLYSNVTADEVVTISAFLQQSAAYTNDYYFGDVIREVLAQINLQRYTDDTYEAGFIYNALYYMQTMQEVFMYLPGNDENYWYCYYRGKVVMLLRSKNEVPGDPLALVSDLQNLPDSPFSSIVIMGQEDMAYKYYSVVIDSVEGRETYLAVALNCKTVVERFLDTVDGVFTDTNTNNGTLCTFNATDFKLKAGGDSANSVLFTVKFSMVQSPYFHLADVCQAVYLSPFFKNYSGFAFDDSDNDDYVDSVELQFILVNDAVDAIHDYAIGYFSSQSSVLGLE